MAKVAETATGAQVKGIWQYSGWISKFPNLIDSVFNISKYSQLFNYPTPTSSVMLPKCSWILVLFRNSEAKSVLAQCQKLRFWSNDFLIFHMNRSWVELKILYHCTWVGVNLNSRNDQIRSDSTIVLHFTDFAPRCRCTLELLWQCDSLSPHKATTLYLFFGKLHTWRHWL